MHVHLIVAGLDASSRLAKSIFKEPVKSLEEFRNRSTKYLELEQMEIANAPPKESRGRSPRRRSPRKRDIDRTCDKGRNPDDRQPRGKYEKYAPLNVPRSQIWKEVVSTEMKQVDRPRPLHNKVGLDNSGWDLRDAIEKYIREGKLRHYLIRSQGGKNKRKDKNHSQSPQNNKKKKDGEKKSDSDNEEFREAEYECNVIMGALGGGGDTVSARKKYLKELLSIRDRPQFKEDPNHPDPPLLFFMKEEPKDVVPGHVDGLVITGILVNCRVKKMFIDNGSVADIIL